jgi:hypothetical protein
LAAKVQVNRREVAGLGSAFAPGVAGVQQSQLHPSPVGGRVTKLKFFICFDSLAFFVPPSWVSITAPNPPSIQILCFRTYNSFKIRFR